MRVFEGGDSATIRAFVRLNATLNANTSDNDLYCDAYEASVADCKTTTHYNKNVDPLADGITLINQYSSSDIDATSFLFGCQQ